jgi:glyoxylate carboligase
MANAPFTGRWSPVPVQAAFDLGRSKGPAAVLVWLSMLSDALQNKNWQTSRAVAAIVADTGVTRNTVTKVQAALVEAGYATVLSGGGKTRRKTTFAMTPIANFGKTADLPDSKPSKPIGNW